MSGSHLPCPKLSLQLVKFWLRYAMRIMFGMYLLEFWVISSQNCEAVIFTKFESACMHARLIKYLDAPILNRAYAPYMCVHVIHTQHDVNVTKVCI